MKGPIVRALALDAIYQVLDNLVFRIFAVLTLFPIALTFLLGFQREEVVLGFGLARWSYVDLYRLIGAEPGADPRGETLEALIQIVFNFLGGMIGVLFCIAATAFFVPRMIEKGAADVLFHKPVSRTALYLSRFLAGLVFVAFLSTVLALGMYVGFLLVSRHGDPGIFCAALALTYAFGLVYSVSMLCGILTRSSVAALLVTVIFFVVNGAVHLTWTITEDARVEHAAGVEPSPPEVRNSPGFFARGVSFLHYLLPKTSDAELLARKLRRAVAVSLWADEGSTLRLYELPDGFALDPAPTVPPPAPAEAALADTLGEARLALRQEAAGLVATLWRRPARAEESTVAGKTRAREEFTRAAADALEAALPGGKADEANLDFASNARGIGGVSAYRLAWDDGALTRVALVFKGRATEEGARAFLFTLLISGPRGWFERTGAETARRLDVAFGLAPRANDLEDLLTFDADWRHNIFFSVGSSLLFAFVMLALGAWRLERMEL